MFIVSACLVGTNCKYNGGNNFNKKIYDLVQQGKAILVCPEQLGGLTTPRDKCEIIKFREKDKKVVTERGKDVTEEFLKGADETLKIAKAIKADFAILKSNSPSCGLGYIYDGTFNNNLVKGNGITAEKLINNGIRVYNEKNQPFI
ncbi:MAG: DUF523 domain-containing protein [Firmicutes bacterium]|nr:DUF523 domain-containing protein [Bacillota bacterium]MTI69786.1 DUF523 domain-containing protein [Bacillota bacterium]